MRRGGLLVCNGAWCEKGTMRRLFKLRVCEEITVRACVHSFWLAKSLGLKSCPLSIYDNVTHACNLPPELFKSLLPQSEC